MTTTFNAGEENKKEEDLPYVDGNLFPRDYANNKLPLFLAEAMKEISGKLKAKDLARIPGNFNADTYKKLAEKYGIFPEHPNNPIESIKRIASDFTSGAPLWRSANLQYNLGAPTNIAAVAMYALALDINIYNINDGLAGNALAAEKAVSKILSSLADIDPDKSFGLFTFGGTATNLYALKVATRRIFPMSGITGVPKNIIFMVTEDAHFSHAVAVDWLGVGTENIVTIRANADRTSDIFDAESKMRAIFEKGSILGAIMLNGGTTYDHAIDDILAFVQLRDRLVKEYKLSYIPHLHIDAVVGWAWLVFKNYDFKKNNIKISHDVLEKIKIQYERIKNLKYADSWGVDFHKGVGACPIPCSIIMMNDKKNFMHLSKSNDPMTITHQLAGEFSFESPSEYTLETSRPGGAPLAALTSLYTLGQSGYQSYLAHLVSISLLTKRLIANNDGFVVCNPYSLGYVTMVRAYPPEFAQDSRKAIELSSPREDVADFTYQVNKYMKAFFSWDYRTRIRYNKGVEYSYSGTYIRTPLGIKIPAIKFYPTSPHISEQHVRDSIELLIKQKAKFDSEIWEKTNN
jgi:glutamate/tyrosine decarboxylase-like PLP-dependent enzyme